MKIAHIGNLANLGALTCVFLRRLGVDAHLYVNELQGFKPVPAADHNEKYEWVHIIPRKNNFHYAWTHTKLSFDLAKYDLVHSWTASLLPMAELLLKVIGKQYFASATGSDLREAARERGINGFRIRKHFQNAAWVAHTFDTQTIEVAEKLKLKNCTLFKIPTNNLHDNHAKRLFKEIIPIFFCPSRLNIRKNHPHERVSKNNDRFIKAFARFINAGGKAKLVLVKHGSNKDEVIQLTQKLGIAQNITWVDYLTPAELINMFNRCDVVVDQFNDLSYPAPGGGITFEAMSCAKPILTYFDVSATINEYGEAPPILTCKTEDEILARIESCTDLTQLEKRGKACQKWCLKHHGWEKLTHELINSYKKYI